MHVRAAEPFDYEGALCWIPLQGVCGHLTIMACFPSRPVHCNVLRCSLYFTTLCWSCVVMCPNAGYTRLPRNHGPVETAAARVPLLIVLHCTVLRCDVTVLVCRACVATSPSWRSRLAAARGPEYQGDRAPTHCTALFCCCLAVGCAWLPHNHGALAWQQYVDRVSGRSQRRILEQLGHWTDRQRSREYQEGGRS